MKPGIYDKISMSEYLALPYFSASLAHTLLTYSPHHAKFEQDHHVQDDNDASDIGTAIHDELLEGINRIEVIEAKSWRTDAAKEQRKLARLAGKIPLLAAKVPQVQRAVDAAKAFILESEIAGVFDEGKPEQTVIWDEDGVLCKARPDWLTERWHISVKTTAGSAEPNSWIRNQLVPMGYDVSALFYERGLTGFQPHGQTVFLVIEQTAPHGVALIGLSPASHDLASRKVERAIHVWRECQQSGKWPCYPTRICYAEPLGYQLAAEEERDLKDAYDQLQAKEGLQA